MLCFIPIISLFLAGWTTAIDFTNPALNSTLTKGSAFDLTWSSVDTDPTSFSIYLWNFVNWPPLYTPLAYDVKSSSNQAKVYIPCDVDTTYGYQFTAINDTNVYIIYAQSPLFSIDGNTCTNAPGSLPTGGGSVPTTTTVTVTATATATATCPSSTAGAPTTTTVTATCPSSGTAFPSTVTVTANCPSCVVSTVTVTADHPGCAISTTTASTSTIANTTPIVASTTTTIASTTASTTASSSASTTTVPSTEPAFSSWEKEKRAVVEHIHQHQRRHQRRR